MEDGDSLRVNTGILLSHAPAPAAAPPAAAPPSPRPIRLQDIPMRIVTRRRRSTTTTMSLSRATLPQLPACKPPLPASVVLHESCQPAVSLTPAVDVEALRQKADMAELEAKTQRNTTLKALEARRRAERQAAELIVEKEHVEQDLRQATIAHQRLAQTFKRVVANKRKVEAQLKKEQQHQQQKQEQEEEVRHQQALAESTTSATTTVSQAPSYAITHDHDDDDQEATRASALAKGLQEELARREADLMNLHAKLKRQGQARRTQLKEWEAELHEKEERVRRVAEKLRKQREHLRVCQERAQRQMWEGKGRTRQATSKLPQRSLSSSPLRARRVQRIAESQTQASYHAPALLAVVEEQEQQRQLLSTLLLLANRGGSLSITDSTPEKKEGKDEEEMERREPVAAVAAAPGEAVAHWDEAPRRRHWPQYSTSSSAVDGKEEDRDVALDSILPVSAKGADNGDGLGEQYKRDGSTGRRMEEDQGNGQEGNRLFWTLDKVMAAGPDQGSASSHDFIEKSTVSRAAVAPKHSLPAPLAPPAIPQLPPSIRSRRFQKEVDMTLEKIQTAKLRVAETCALASSDGRNRSRSQSMPPRRAQPSVAITTKVKITKEKNEVRAHDLRGTSSSSQGDRLQWLNAFDGRLAKSMCAFARLKA